MIRQVLMALGDFSFRLRPDTPLSIREAITPWDLFMVTPSWIPDKSADRSTILAAAEYSGRIEKWSNQQLDWAGESSMVYMGDGDNPPRGDFPIGFSIFPPKTWAQFVTAAFSTPKRVGGLTLGNYFSPPAGVINGDGISDTEAVRFALLRLARIAGAEYRVNPDGTFDSGIATALWKSGAAIDTLLMKGAEGNDPDGLHGLNVTDWQVTYSASELCGGTYVNNPDPAVVPGSTFSSPIFMYNGFDGTTNWSPFHYMQVSNTDFSAGGDGDKIAANYMLAHGAPRFEIACRVSTPNLLRYLTKGQPGDYVYLYDRESQIYDTSNQTTFRGQPISPLATHRIVECTTPISSGKGCYSIGTRHGTNAVTDLTEFIQWEDGDSDIVLSTTNPLTVAHVLLGDGHVLTTS